MRTILQAIAVWAMIILSALASEDAKLSESLRARFSKVREILNIQGELESVSSEKAMLSEFGTAIRRGVDMKSRNVDVTLDATTGRVLFIQTRTGIKQQNAPSMNGEQAEVVARSLVQKLGCEVAKDWRVLYRCFDPLIGCWSVTWERRVDGYPFPEEVVFIQFNDRDQRIARFSDCTTAMTCPTTPVIDKKQARVSAEVCIRKDLPERFGKDYAIASVDGGNLQVVYPNGYSLVSHGSQGSRPFETAPQPRLVYEFDFEFKYTGVSKFSICTPPCQIWVDAQTGKVVGGL